MERNTRSMRFVFIFPFFFLRSRESYHVPVKILGRYLCIKLSFENSFREILITGQQLAEKQLQTRKVHVLQLIGTGEM